MDLIERIVGFCNFLPVRRTVHPVSPLAAAKYAFDMLCSCFDANELDAQTLFGLTKCGGRDMYNIAEEEDWKTLWISAHRSGDLARDINTLLRSGVLDSFAPDYLSKFFTLFNSFIVGTEFVGRHIIRRVVIASFPLENGKTTADIHAYFKARYSSSKNLPMDWQREQTKERYETLAKNRPSLNLLKIRGVPIKLYSGVDAIRSDFRFFLTERSMREKGANLPAGVLYEIGSTFRAIYSMVSIRIAIDLAYLPLQITIILVGPTRAMSLLQVAGGARKKPIFLQVEHIRSYAAVSLRAEIERVYSRLDELEQRIDDLGDRLMLSKHGFLTLAFDFPGLLDASAKFIVKNAADWTVKKTILLADWIVCDLFTDENWLQLGRDLGCVHGSNDNEKILFSWLDRPYDYNQEKIREYREDAAKKTQLALKARVIEPHKRQAEELRDMADKVREQAKEKKVAAASLLARVKEVTVDSLDKELRSEVEKSVVAKINKDVKKSASNVDDLKKRLAAAEKDLKEKVELQNNPADIVTQKEEELVVEKQEELKVEYKNAQDEFKQLCSEVKKLEARRQTALNKARREVQDLPVDSIRGPVAVDLNFDDDENDTTSHRAHRALLQRMSAQIVQAAPRDTLSKVRAAYQQLARDVGIVRDCSSDSGSGSDHSGASNGQNVHFLGII